MSEMTFNEAAYEKLKGDGKSETYARAYASKIHEGEVRNERVPVFSLSSSDFSNASSSLLELYITSFLKGTARCSLRARSRRIMYNPLSMSMVHSRYVVSNRAATCCSSCLLRYVEKKS